MTSSVCSTPKFQGHTAWVSLRTKILPHSLEVGFWWCMLDMEQLVDEEPSFYPTSCPKFAKRKLNGKCSLLLHYYQTCFGTGKEISWINLACQDWSKVLYVGGIQELWCATCLSCMTERINKLDFFPPIALICGASCQQSLQLCQLHHQTTNQAHQTLQTLLQVSHLMKWLHHHQQHLQQASVSPYNFLNMIIFIDIVGQVMCSWMTQWPLCLRCRWLLVQRLAKSNEAYPHKCVAAWIRILLTFLIICIYSVLAGMMTESSRCFQKCNRNSDTIFFEQFTWIF